MLLKDELSVREQKLFAGELVPLLQHLPCGQVAVVDSGIKVSLSDG